MDCCGCGTRSPLGPTRSKREPMELRYERYARAELTGRLATGGQRSKGATLGPGYFGDRPDSPRRPRWRSAGDRCAGRREIGYRRKSDWKALLGTRATPETDPILLGAHSGAVWDLCVLADGRQVVTGGFTVGYGFGIRPSRGPNRSNSGYMVT